MGGGLLVPAGERILSRAWLAFTVTSTSARLSTLGARMDTPQPTDAAASAIQKARPTMAGEVHISLPLPGAPASAAPPDQHRESR
jgi:hypothetical protein